MATRTIPANTPDLVLELAIEDMEMRLRHNPNYSIPHDNLARTLIAAMKEIRRLRAEITELKREEFDGRG